MKILIFAVLLELALAARYARDVDDDVIKVLPSVIEDPVTKGFTEFWRNHGDKVADIGFEVGRAIGTIVFAIFGISAFGISLWYGLMVPAAILFYGFVGTLLLQYLGILNFQNERPGIFSLTIL